MIGTIVNTCTIVAGTLIGVALHKGIKDKYKNVLYDALGLACFAIGLNAVVTNLPKSQYPVLFIAAMAIGSVVGVALDIDGRFHRLVDRKSKRGGEGSSGTRLADGLATATLVYCIGPLSMLGPVISALEGDHTFLFTNATLYLVTATIFGSTYGIGMLLAAPALFLWGRERGADGRAAHRGRPDDHGLGPVAAAHQGLPCAQHAARAAGAAVVVPGHVADPLI